MGQGVHPLVSFDIREALICLPASIWVSPPKMLLPLAQTDSPNFLTTSVECKTLSQNCGALTCYDSSNGTVPGSSISTSRQERMSLFATVESRKLQNTKEGP